MGLIIFFYYGVNLILLLLGTKILFSEYEKNQITPSMIVFGFAFCIITYFFIYRAYKKRTSNFLFSPWFDFPKYYILFPSAIGIILSYFSENTILHYFSNTMLFTSFTGAIIIIVFKKYTFSIFKTFNIPYSY